jgi:hypothetical protein
MGLTKMKKVRRQIRIKVIAEHTYDVNTIDLGPFAARNLLRAISIVRHT